MAPQPRLNLDVMLRNYSTSSCVRCTLHRLINPLGCVFGGKVPRGSRRAECFMWLVVEFHVLFLVFLLHRIRWGEVIPQSYLDERTEGSATCGNIFCCFVETVWFAKEKKIVCLHYLFLCFGFCWKKWNSRYSYIVFRQKQANHEVAKFIVEIRLRMCLYIFEQVENNF